MFETGTVKFFDRRQEKRFGFLSLQNGEDIHFHFDNGRVLIFDSYPKFVQGATLQEPRKGDNLLFLRAESWNKRTKERRTKADVWVHQANWQDILHRYPSLPYY